MFFDCIRSSTCASTTSSSGVHTTGTVSKTTVNETSTYQHRDIESVEETSVNTATSSSTTKNANETIASGACVKQQTHNEEDEIAPPKLWSHSMKSSSTYSSLALKPRQR